jgi:hypothetical protein
MDTIQLNAQTIDAYKKILDEPETYKVPTKKWCDVIQESDICTAKHILYNQVQQYWPNLPKIIFYIISDERFRIGKANDGNLGYFASIIP